MCIFVFPQKYILIKNIPPIRARKANPSETARLIYTQKFILNILNDLFKISRVIYLRPHFNVERLHACALLSCSKCYFYFW